MHSLRFLLAAMCRPAIRVAVALLAIAGCSKSQPLPIDPNQSAISDAQSGNHVAVHMSQTDPAVAIQRPGLTLTLPGADASIPDWVDQRQDEPFPVREFLLSRQAPADNAAPYYLLGLAELASDLNFVFPESEREQQRARTSSLGERCSELIDLVHDANQTVPLEEVEQVLSEAATGLHFLDEAQKHENCVFICGNNYTAVLPHAQGARVVARLAELEIYFAISRRDPDRAYRAIERVLRLSRDLRPRGGVIVQLVSMAMDLTVVQRTQELILPSNLSLEQCDRLMALFHDHEQKSQDLLDEGFRMEYITFGNSLEGMKAGRLTEDDLDLGGKLPAGLVKYDIEWKEANRLYGQLLAYLDLDYHKVLQESAFADEFQRLKTKLQESTVAAALFPKQFDQPIVCLFTFPDFPNAREAESRHFVRLRGIQALIAVRRYQIVHGDAPSTLAEAMMEAGRKDLPIDPYSGESLHYTIVADEPIIYSVGKDQVDDGGQVDWDYGRQPGDFILRLGR